MSHDVKPKLAHPIFLIRIPRQKRDSSFSQCLWHVPVWAGSSLQCPVLMEETCPDCQSPVSCAHWLTLDEEFGKCKRIVNIPFTWAHVRKCRSNGGTASSPQRYCLLRLLWISWGMLNFLVSPSSELQILKQCHDEDNALKGKDVEEFKLFFTSKSCSSCILATTV